MFKEGRLMTCDICGMEEFQEADGNRLNYSRDIIEGAYVDSHCALSYRMEKMWPYVPGLGTLCPSCNRAVTDLFGVIKEKGVVPSGETEEGE